MAGPQTEKKMQVESPVTDPRTLEISPDEAHRNKVDEAFALLEKLDGNTENESSEYRLGGTKTETSGILGASRSGLRIRFGVDALVSDKDTCATGPSGARPGEAKLIDFGITLPHVWRIPLVGKAALKLIRHLQKENSPRTVREILKSLRQSSD